MVRISRILASVLAFGFVVAAGNMPASAQSLGDTVGGLVDGIGISGGTDSGTSAGVSAGGTSATADASSTGSGTGANLNVANLNTLGGTTTQAGLSTGNTSNGASINLPALGGVAVNDNSSLGRLGVNPGVNLGLNLGTSGLPATNSLPTGNPSVNTNRVVASLSDDQIAQFAIRCRQILLNPRGFDRDLVALCHVIKNAAR